MKKSNKLFLIVALSLLVLGILTLLISFGIAGFSFLGYNVGVDYTAKDFAWSVEEQANIGVIFLEESSRDVRIVPSQDGVLRFRAFDGYGRTYRTSLAQDGTLKLTFDHTKVPFRQHFQIAFYPPDITSVLEVPCDFAGTVQIKTASGDIAVTGNTAVTSQATWNLETASGDVDIRQLKTQKNLKILSTSGDIDFDHITANAVRINSTSGDIDVDSLTATQDCYAESASGEISFDSLNCAFLTCKTASGDVELDRFDFTSASEISTLSGNISLELKRGENRYLIDGVSKSGDSVSLKLGEIPILLRSQSGDIHID